MAIGDAVAVLLGTAIENYQPASGVEVQISSIMRNANTDDLSIYDGTNLVTIMVAQYLPAAPVAGESGAFNCAIAINNTYYFRKTGTTDFFFSSGVQTGA
jgi:hypothetical protein